MPEEERPEIILEQEVNDSVAQPQFVARIAVGDALSIIGDVAPATGDEVDVLELFATEPVRVAVSLSFEPVTAGGSADLDLFVEDTVRLECGGDPPIHAAYFATDANPEFGAIEVEGTFFLLVRSADGAARYQLDISAEPIAGSKRRMTSRPVEAVWHRFPTGVRTGRRPVPPNGWGPVQDGGGREDMAPVPHARAIAGEQVSESVAGEVLIVFERGVTPQRHGEVMRRFGLRAIEESPSGVIRAVVADPGARSPNPDAPSTATIIGALAALPQVRCAEPNWIVRPQRLPNDRFVNLQWHYEIINLPQAWDMTIGSEEVVVAIIDTGIVSAHPDLQGRIGPGYDFISELPRARDGDGRDDDPEDPGDLAGGPQRSSFHGTTVAGIIAAATDNARGIAGVTWQGRVMPIRALGVNGGTAFESAEAIRYAAGLPNVSGTVPDRPARIINMSYGRTDRSQVEAEAIAEAAAAGCVLIGAAGNGISSAPFYPASLPEVINVSAVDLQLDRAIYSNYGRTVDLAAPGGFNGIDINGDGLPDGVLSTGARDFTSGLSLRYDLVSGTSMAAPHVAGVAALVLAANPDLSAAAVREILETTAVDLGDPGRDDDFGHGLIDAAAAVREARRRAGITPDSTPILVANPSALDFGDSLRSLRVRLFNAGGGTIEVTSVEVEEFFGARWLRASLRGGTATDITAEEVLISVDRAGQPDGVLLGAVTVDTAGSGRITVDVAASVGDAPLSPERMFVQATDRATGEVVAEQATDASTGFAFAFADLPPGDYVLVGGSDLNDDGVICELGDYCGIWPTFNEPGVVTTTASSRIADIEFAVSRRLLRQATAQGMAPP